MIAVLVIPGLNALAGGRNLKCADKGASRRRREWGDVSCVRAVHSRAKAAKPRASRALQATTVHLVRLPRYRVLQADTGVARSTIIQVAPSTLAAGTRLRVDTLAAGTSLRVEQSLRVVRSTRVILSVGQIMEQHVHR